MCFVESSDLIKKLMEGSIVEVRVYDQTDYAKNKNETSISILSQRFCNCNTTSVKQCPQNTEKPGEWWDQKWKSPMRFIESPFFMDHSLSGVGVER